jgi:hypothetical protein
MLIRLTQPMPMSGWRRYSHTISGFIRSALAATALHHRRIAGVHESTWKKAIRIGGSGGRLCHARSWR